VSGTILFVRNDPLYGSESAYSMIGDRARHGADIACCGACLDARGITEAMLTKGTRRSTLDELADWSHHASRVITF
jgi:uncharacterized protein involved in oxidation of intracellular sulfur